MPNAKKLTTLCIALLFLFTIAFGFSALAATKSSVNSSRGKSVETRKKEIVSKWKTSKPTFFDTDFFETTPSTSAPYSIGKVKSAVIKDASKMINFLRYLADLPADVSLTSENNQNCQYGAVLMAANDTLSHSPAKPANMSESFYKIGYANAQSSNIGLSWDKRETSAYGVYKYMDDSDSGNIDRLGHRRWILNPPMLYSGMGFANKGPNLYFTLYAFDMSRQEEVNYNEVIWPNGSAFPSNFFEGHMAWSVTLNPTIYQKPSASAIAVKLTSAESGKSWSFSNSTKDKSGNYFNVNLDNYGVDNCIVFRPNGIEEYSGKYSVSIKGLKKKDGSAATLNYSVTFFKLSDAELVVKN